MAIQSIQGKQAFIFNETLYAPSIMIKAFNYHEDRL